MLENIAHRFCAFDLEEIGNLITFSHLSRGFLFFNFFFLLFSQEKHVSDAAKVKSKGEDGEGSKKKTLVKATFLKKNKLPEKVELSILINCMSTLNCLCL